MNNINPSNKASYIWEGCLGNISMAGKITDHGTSVTFPTSSPLIKLAILPKNIPIGETQAITSSKKNVDIFFFVKKCMYLKLFQLKHHEKTSRLPKLL